MNHVRWIALVVLFASASAWAQQTGTAELVESYDGYRLVVFVEEQDIASSPTWGPDSEAPPLSIAEAIRAVKRFGKDLDSSNTISEIELRPVPNHDGYWHYLIEVSDEKMSHKFSVFVVLMNGKVIPAIVEPVA
jgi:hypothetical protein